MGVPPLRDGDIGPLIEARVRLRDLHLMAFHPQLTTIGPATRAARRIAAGALTPVFGKLGRCSIAPPPCDP